MDALRKEVVSAAAHDADALRLGLEEAALEIEAVCKRYGDVQALDNLSLSIGRGEYFGLLGPNGAGKSTLINAIAGLVRADSGRIRVLGHDNRSDYRAARRLLGVVPQELVFDPFFSVEDVLKLQAGYYGCGAESREWIEILIERLDLGFKRHASMRTLSGGQKRRVMLAQAMVHRPQVVILDEPTAGVDVELRRTLWEFTRELHAQGTTIVLTTHYLDEAQALCDRIAIVDRGRLKLTETTEQLLSRSACRFLQLQLADGAALPPALEPLVVKRENGSVELRLERDENPVASVMAALKAADVDIADIHIREPRLEDVFIGLTYGARGG